MKGFYLDFRVFWAESEDKTKFILVTSLLGKHCSDRRLRKLLSVTNKEWKDNGLLYEWHDIKADEMINAIFNGELFHTDPEKRKDLEKIRSIMSNDFAHFQIVFSIYQRMLLIRNINWVIEPLLYGQQAVRIPPEYDK